MAEMAETKMARLNRLRLTRLRKQRLRQNDSDRTSQAEKSCSESAGRCTFVW